MIKDIKGDLAVSENCKLCGKVDKLRNSHIIPEFLFKPLYDSKHRFHVLSTVLDSPNRYEQKGIREKLLCQSCETLLSKHEGYARTVLFGGTEISVRKEDGNYIIGDIDYKKFKLFQISILWRAGISNHRLQNCFLTDSGSVPILSKPFEYLGFIRGFANQLHQSGKMLTIKST